MFSILFLIKSFAVFAAVSEPASKTSEKKKKQQQKLLIQQKAICHVGNSDKK